MSTHIHVSGLSYFCSDEELRQAFTPYGRVVLAHVLRDEWGHSLGLGVVHMASSECSTHTSVLRSPAREWISGNLPTRRRGHIGRAMSGMSELHGRDEARDM